MKTLALMMLRQRIIVQSQLFYIAITLEAVLADLRKAENPAAI